VRNPFRPSAIVLLSLLSVATQAQKIFVAGVKRAADCKFATKPLIHDLQAIRHAHDWTIVVVCNEVVWQRLRRKADAQGTDTAFTNVQHRITVLNSLMYLEELPLRGTAHHTPQLVLQHEYGHILCECDDEMSADRAAGIVSAWRAAAFH
jgi:hypothetical protein